MTCPLCERPAGVPDTPPNREVLAFLAGVGAGHALGASSTLPAENESVVNAQLGLAQAIEQIQACELHGPSVNAILLVVSLDLSVAGP